jgi:hypothetical protein
MIQLQSLEGVTNAHVTERLEQIRSILRDAISGAEDAIKRATADMLALEAQINNDAVNLVYTAKCAADITLLDTAQKAFGKFITTIRNADPSLKIFGIKVIDLSTNEVQITNPDIAYTSTRSAVMTLLDKTITDDSKAYDILSAYQNLEISAKFNSCYYNGQASQVIWIEEINELERLSLPWTAGVKPDINYIRR